MSLLPFIAAQLVLAVSPAVVLEDPRHDDDGGGSLVYPSGSEYPAGCFDLRRLEVEVGGEEVVFRVTLGAAITRPSMVRRTHATELHLDNGIYVQNVDIYIDQVPGAGHTRGIPGRNVRFSRDEAWDAAVVLTPQPHPTRALLERSLPEEAPHVHVATGVRSEGRTVIARVPLAALGGRPDPAWGYSVVVSGAAWEETFAAVERLTGAFRENAFTLPIYAIPEERALGGGTLDPHQPRVIDISTPAGVDQHARLSDFDSRSERLAVIPMTYPDPEATLRLRTRLEAAAPRAEATLGREPPSPLELVVLDVDGESLVLSLAGREVSAWRQGTVIDAEGREVARIVVTAVYPKFVTATAVEGRAQIRPGDRVRFPREEKIP